MNKRVKKKWLKALRSSEYEQAKGTLRKVDNKNRTLGFCCLGVLCNIHAQEHPEIASKQRDPHIYLGQEAFLPEEVCQWAGLPYSTGAYIAYKGEEHTLTSLNDSIGLSFKRIANIVEKQL